MLIVVSLLAAFSGFSAICVSMRKHQREVWKKPLDRRSVVALRLAGCALLALAWWPCAAIWGLGMGTVAWVCCVGLAPIALVFPLAYAPKPSALAGGVAGALAVVASLGALLVH
ncbi:MAG: DUF3325 domain-containing protein [Steroidobacteraceae bacterium]